MRCCVPGRAVSAARPTNFTSHGAPSSSAQQGPTEMATYSLSQNGFDWCLSRTSLTGGGGAKSRSPPQIISDIKRRSEMGEAALESSGEDAPNPCLLLNILRLMPPVGSRSGQCQNTQFSHLGPKGRIGGPQRTQTHPKVLVCI